MAWSAWNVPTVGAGAVAAAETEFVLPRRSARNTPLSTMSSPQSAATSLRVWVVMFRSSGAVVRRRTVDWSYANVDEYGLGVTKLGSRDIAWPLALAVIDVPSRNAPKPSRVKSNDPYTKSNEIDCVPGAVVNEIVMELASCVDIPANVVRLVSPAVFHAWLIPAPGSA